jgi:hypothetical protein
MLYHSLVNILPGKEWRYVYSKGAVEKALEKW